MTEENPNEQTNTHEGKAETPRRAALYARSAPSQERGEENCILASQIKQYRTYCQQQGYSVEDTHIYTEIGSGIDEYSQRGQLTALFEAAERGAFDIVIVTCVKRFSRRFAHIATILDKLEQLGICVESIEEPNGFDEVTQLLLAAQEQMEQIQRQQMSKRIRHGRSAKKAQE